MVMPKLNISFFDYSTCLASSLLFCKNKTLGFELAKEETGKKPNPS